MKWRYLIIESGFVWAKHELTKDYFVQKATQGAIIIDLQESKIFEAESNQWIDLEGDQS